MTCAKASRLIDMAIAFCNTIATLFEFNEKERYMPNYLYYVIQCSKESKTCGNMEILANAFGVNDGFSTKVYDFMSVRILKSIQERKNNKRLSNALEKFFTEKNKMNQKKMLIAFSSLLPMYLIAHENYKESCNESNFLKYIHFLAFEMLDPWLINIGECKKSHIKLASTKNFNKICEKNASPSPHQTASK